MSYFSKHYLVYVGRWILSAVVMMPFLYLVSLFIENQYISLIIIQIIGSLIFYKIDAYLFSIKIEKELG